MKTIDEVRDEICELLRTNGLFGAAYIDNGLTWRVVDCARSPYHAGAMQVMSALVFQRDYKSMGGEIYEQFRAGFGDAGKSFGATFNKESEFYRANPNCRSRSQKRGGRHESR